MATVISYFLSQNLLLAVNFAPTALAASLAVFISLIVFCLPFLPPNELSFSFASLIYVFILILLCWAQLFFRTIVFPLLKYCFDLLFYTSSQWKQDRSKNVFVICVCTYREFKANKEDN